MTTKNNKPKAIVLSKVVTGLATIRGIAKGQVDVIAAIFKSDEPVKYSLCCSKVDISNLSVEQEILEWLIDYVKKIKPRPVVIPTSDELALMLARNYEILSPYCRLWQTDYEDLKKIVNKNSLYSIADAAGIKTVPAIVEPNLEQIREWASSNSAPYFLKPFYEGIAECKLTQKNLILKTREELIDYVNRTGAKALVVQRLIQGGDGFIFDTYGLCDKNGKILTIASHRRWRQHPPDTGTTSLGEIPGAESKVESVLFENTNLLLREIKFHGIFGIEWLQDKNTGEHYIIDFNARPFTSIGHLTSCGLNLPLLAYRELLEEDLSDVEYRPLVKHKYWIDFLHDLWSLKEKKERNEIKWLEWAKSVLPCKSFAYWDWRDPGPGIYRAYQICRIIIVYLSKKIKNSRK